MNSLPFLVLLVGWHISSTGATSKMDTIKDPVFIVDSGLYPVEVDSVALVFYVTAVNKGGSSFMVKPILDKCCLRDDNEAKEFDCKSMTLHMGAPKVIYPNDIQKFTMIFSNLYVTDRLGECVIHLEYMKNTTIASVQHTLKFDTVLPSSPRYCNWIPPNMRDFLFGVTVTDCDGIDQDRARDCEPVNCVLKYNGYRNFYNETSMRCDEVPSCTHGQTSSLPAKAYNPHKNRCVDLDVSLTPEDFGHFSIAAKYSKQPSEKFMYRSADAEINCVHGVVSHGQCVCSEGWHSRYTDPATITLDQMIKLCDIPIDAYHFHLFGLDWDVRTDFIMTMTGALVTLTVTLAAIQIYEYCLHRGGARRKKELGSLKRDMTSGLTEFNAGDDEINTCDPVEKYYPKTEKTNYNKGTTKYIGGYAVALMNYSATRETEMSLRVGDVVNDLRYTDKPGVIEGTCHGVVGRFPDFSVNLHQKNQE